MDSSELYQKHIFCISSRLEGKTEIHVSTKLLRVRGIFSVFTKYYVFTYSKTGFILIIYHCVLTEKNTPYLEIIVRSLQLFW